jgi:DNA-binding MarR family transcriptional regulator
VIPQQELPQDDHVEQIRRFNRAYLQKIGILSEKIFDSSFSLTELRIIHELSLHRQTTATSLSRLLSLDGGYLSRILNKFEKNGIVSKQRSLKDARQRKISLTQKGRKIWNAASAKARENILEMLAPLSPEQQQQLMAAMTTISVLLQME